MSCLSTQGHASLKRTHLFKTLDFPLGLRHRINYYLNETKGTCPSVGIVKETTKDICRSLALRYAQVKEKAPSPELTMAMNQPFSNLQKLYEMIGNLTGEVRVIDKNFDTEGFKFFLKLDPAKTTKLQILGGKARVGQTLKEEYKAFNEELQKKGILVEFRTLDDEDTAAIHDRYLLSNEVVYSTPPWNIINKKYGDIRSLASSNEKGKQFEYCWKRGSNLT